MKKTIIIFACAILMTGCSINKQPSSPVALYSSSKSNLLSDYQIDIPTDLEGPLVRENKSLAYWNYDDKTAHRKSGDILLEVYPNESIKITTPNPQIKSCSPTTLGVSSPTDLSKGAVKTLKGRVDYFDDGKELYSTEPRPLCVPPSLNGLSDAEIGKFAKTRAAYAFCSQKDGKTVLICISQMTKNEDVATKIFDSFRWTK